MITSRLVLAWDEGGISSCTSDTAAHDIPFDQLDANVEVDPRSSPLTT